MLCATNLAVRNDEFKIIITAIQQILTKSRAKSIKTSTKFIIITFELKCEMGGINKTGLLSYLNSGWSS